MTGASVGLVGPVDPVVMFAVSPVVRIGYIVRPVRISCLIRPGVRSSARIDCSVFAETHCSVRTGRPAGFVRCVTFDCLVWALYTVVGYRTYVAYGYGLFDQIGAWCRRRD